jgi:transcriptional regulator with XRE-family HTH domain
VLVVRLVHDVFASEQGGSDGTHKADNSNGQTHPEEPTEQEAAEPVLIEQRQRIGPAIRSLSQQQHLSLSDLAGKTGISVSYLSRLEKGRSVPSFTLLSRLAQDLGVDIGYFVESEHEARAVDDVLMLELSRSPSPIPKSVWPEILGLSLEGRKAIAEYLKQQVPA